MTENHIQENKIWRLIKNLSIILIAVAILILYILLVTGKFTKVEKKEEYGCNLDPDEQIYSKIFTEGNKVKIEYLDNFSRFCLDKNYVQILKNNTIIKNKSVFLGFSNGREYVIRKGEIWTIEYIGKKMDFLNESLSVKEELDKEEVVE